MSRRICSSGMLALVQMGLTSWVRSEPLTSSRTTPASLARSTTRSKAASIRSRIRERSSGFFSKACCSSLRSACFVLA